MDELYEKLEKAMTTIFALFLAGGIGSLTYNAIAWEFNLPPLNYWTILGVMSVIRYILKR